MPEPMTSEGLARTPARPFPWFCPKCRRKEVRRVTMPYQCERLHDGQPITISLTSFSVPRCGNCGELVFDYEAEEQIKRVLSSKSDVLQQVHRIAKQGLEALCRLQVVVKRVEALSSRQRNQITVEEIQRDAVDFLAHTLNQAELLGDWDDLCRRFTVARAKASSNFGQAKWGPLEAANTHLLIVRLCEALVNLWNYVFRFQRDDALPPEAIDGIAAQVRDQLLAQTKKMSLIRSENWEDFCKEINQCIFKVADGDKFGLGWFLRVAGRWFSEINHTPYQADLDREFAIAEINSQPRTSGPSVPVNYDPYTRQPGTLGELEKWMCANAAFLRATQIPSPIALNPPQIAGLDRLSAYCYAKFGGHLSLENVLRLIGEYVIARHVSMDEARAASLQEVADTLVPSQLRQGTAALTARKESEVSDERAFMELAIDEARKSKPELGRKDTPPSVGVVVVKNGQVLGQAHRGELGEGDHAEYTVLEKKLRDRIIAGATVYTTLEPCTRRGKDKVPCAERLIERNVARVVIGILDPNPEIFATSYTRLRKAGIAVQLFDADLVLQIEEINREFIRSQTGGGKLTSQQKPGDILMVDTEVRGGEGQVGDGGAIHVEGAKGGGNIRGIGGKIGGGKGGNAGGKSGDVNLRAGDRTTQGSVISAHNLSGGQVAHSIINIGASEGRRPPKLRLSFDKQKDVELQAYTTTLDPSVLSAWVRIRVENPNGQKVAKRCRGYLSGIKWLGSGKTVEAELTNSSRLLEWEHHPGTFELDLHAGDDPRLDVVHAANNETCLRFSAYPAVVRNTPGRYEITIRVSAEDLDSEFITLRIQWDGSWDTLRAMD